MRVLLAVLFTSITLPLPNVAHANVIEITFIEELDFIFGTTDAALSGDHFRTIRINGLPAVSPGKSGDFFTGEVQLTSGLLQSLVVDDILSRYEYGPGELSVLARWVDRDGNDVQGRFAGVLLGMTIDLCEQQLRTDDGDCGDPWGESRGVAMATLGLGTFDPELARALGVGRRTFGGTFFLSIDGVTGNPLSASRLAGAAEGTGEVEIHGVVVPEPTTTSLLAVFALGAVGYRRLRGR